MLQFAAQYFAAGIITIPVNEKRPAVPWKRLQTERVGFDSIASWFASHPSIGIAAVLGPTGNLFVIDVDGPEAHDVLMEKLGGMPVAPRAISGSRKPFRYHAFFRHPNVPTTAKATPWHPQLEFRGMGGLVVLPPSLHASGQCYAWDDGCSLWECPLPEVPPSILEALQKLPPKAAPESCAPRAQVRQLHPPDFPGISRNTRRFMQGHYAAGPSWNDRIFWAACDLHGNGVALNDAMKWLLAGAQPWNAAEREKARQTIQSAYSQERVAGRKLPHKPVDETPVRTFRSGTIVVRQMEHPMRRFLPPATTITPNQGPGR